MIQMNYGFVNKSSCFYLIYVSSLSPSDFVITLVSRAAAVMIYVYIHCTKSIFLKRLKSSNTSSEYSKHQL